MEKDLIKIDYDNQKSKALRFQAAILEQLHNLLSQQSVTLGTPMEGRIKTLNSIYEKIERKNKSITSVTDLDDFIGIRIIVLFRSDIEKVCDIVKTHFDVVDIEDVSTRLSDDQFGYHSTHYTIKLPKDWLSLPTLADLDQFKAEVQIRTLSQHIWAVASHKLQYKQEQSVPIPLRRSINRVSALLETVDLEFERVLIERENYKDDSLRDVNDSSGFDVLVLEAIGDKLLPKKNKKVGSEDYACLLSQLVEHGFSTVSEVESLINSHLEVVLAKDRSRVEEERFKFDPNVDQDRINQGVFFSHVGLIRMCLTEEVGFL